MSKLLACVILLAAPSVYAAQVGCVPVGECVNGTGTYYFANGDRYEGEWKDGKRDGRGGKPKIFGPFRVLGFSVVDSFVLQSSTVRIAPGSYQPMIHVA